jgi:uncharacterized membrane protein
LPAAENTLPVAKSDRLTALDVARGAALMAMIVYHAIWDGLQFGLIGWTLERDLALQQSAKLIAGSFLLITGVSMALAAAQSSTPMIAKPAFWRRFAMLACAAALVSVATVFALPHAPIYFGILHHIAVASVIMALLCPLPAFVLVALGAAILLIDAYVQIEAFNHSAVIWLGLGTQPPVTADWVPMVPWLAAGLIGLGIGKMFILPWMNSRPPQPHTTDRPIAPVRLLSWMGRHSLAVYLLHQPILIGLIQLYLWLQPH